MFHYDLTLRKIGKQDLRKLFNLKIEAVANHHRTVIINEIDQERWFDSIDKDVYCPKNVFLIGSDKKIDIGIFGLSNINYINRNGDVSCDVFLKHRNKGYGTKLLASGIKFAKEILNLNKLSLEILDYNIASKKISEKNGFVQEGLRKQQVYKNGNYVDSVVYGLIL